MKLARYVGDGRIEIVEEPRPPLPPGGLVVKTEACGLCSGELVAWYMDRKLPHVLGHEVSGRVVESDDLRFPVGARVCPHHHAPCLACANCRRGAYAQCVTWKTTRLVPGGLAEYFAVAKQNLGDTHIVGDLRSVDAALVEPLACVVKSLRQARWLEGQTAAVIGLGPMGLLHMLALKDAVGYEQNVKRLEHAQALRLDARKPSAAAKAEVVYICPGTQAALDLGLQIVNDRGLILLFAPFGPNQPSLNLDEMYFRDITFSTSYSAGPDDIEGAITLVRQGRVRAEQVVSDFCSLDELPSLYTAAAKGEILKAMVLF